MKAVDWMTGHPFIMVNGVYFYPGIARIVDDEQLIAMVRAHPDFSVEEANNGEAKERQGEEKKEKQQDDQDEKQTGYSPVKKKKHKKKKAPAGPTDGGSHADARPNEADPAC